MMGVTNHNTPQGILMSGNLVAKPSVLIEKITVGGDKCGEYKMSYMLSQDFVEFDSHSKFAPAYQYEPELMRRGVNTYTENKPNYPKIAFGPEERVYVGVEKYLKRRAKMGKDFRKVENGVFLFSTKLDYDGRILYLYAFSDKTIWSHEMLGLFYNADIQGTPLEKKLMAALDEAARTYREVKR